jgi:hypothetical protein
MAVRLLATLITIISKGTNQNDEILSDIKVTQVIVNTTLETDGGDGGTYVQGTKAPIKLFLSPNKKREGREGRRKTERRKKRKYSSEGKERTFYFILFVYCGTVNQIQDFTHVKQLYH